MSIILSNTSDSLPNLEKLPSYASIDPFQTRLGPSHPLSHLPNPAARFETMSTTHTHLIHPTSTGGLNITLSTGHQLYYVGRYEDHQPHQSSHQPADLILYGGYDAYSPQLAQTKFTLGGKDFQFYLGSLKHPRSQDWEIVRSASDGHLFHAPYYRFSTRSTKLFWQKTHDPRLGASRFASHDFKLVDEGSSSEDEVVAVYTEHGNSSAGGKVEWRRELGEVAEVACLVVVMTIVEKLRRKAKFRSRVMTGPNGW